eukprot:7386096-Prymnesium_polylepis.2
MGKGKLGPDFWAQWYRLDDNQYTEKKFRDELVMLQVQHELEPESGPKITVDELQQNLLKIKEHMRSKGFRVPAASDKRVICVLDLQSRSCNSAYLLVQCDNCPEHIKKVYRANVMQSKEASQRLSDKTLGAIAEQAATQTDECRPQKKARHGSTDDIRSYSERKLTPQEIEAVDEKLARFCFSEGLPFKALACQLGAARRVMGGGHAALRLDAAPPLSRR